MIELNTICELIVDCEHKTAPTQEAGYPSIRTPNIGRGYLILDGVNRVSEATYREWTRRATPQAGDLIMAREAPVGNVAIVPPGLFPCLGQRTLLIRPNREKVYPEYLNYLLNGPEVQSIIHAKTNGATVPHLNMKDVRGLRLPSLPPLPTQRRVAGILSAYDDLIENNRRRVKILETMARSIYREWFVKFRFPRHESVPRVTSPLGEIPDGWSCVRLADIGALTVGGDWGRDEPEADGWVRVGCLRGVDLHAFSKHGHSEPPVRWIKSLSLEKRRVAPTDVLIEGSGECGRSLAGSEHLERLTGLPVVYSNFCKRVRLRNALVARYVEHMLNEMVVSGEMGQYRTGTTIPNLNMSALFESHWFVLPPQGLLRKFVDLLCSADAFKLSGRTQNLRRTRDLLLPRLLSGQIDVEAMPS